MWAEDCRDKEETRGTHAHTHARTQASKQARTHAHTHARTHTHTHTHTHTISTHCRWAFFFLFFFSFLSFFHFRWSFSFFLCVSFYEPAQFPNWLSEARITARMAMQREVKWKERSTVSNVLLLLGHPLFPPGSRLLEEEKAPTKMHTRLADIWFYQLDRRKKEPAKCRTALILCSGALSQILINSSTNGMAVILSSIHCRFSPNVLLSFGPI